MRKKTIEKKRNKKAETSFGNLCTYTTNCGIKNVNFFIYLNCSLIDLFESVFFMAACHIQFCSVKCKCNVLHVCSTWFFSWAGMENDLLFFALSRFRFVMIFPHLWLWYNGCFLLICYLQLSRHLICHAFIIH